MGVFARFLGKKPKSTEEPATEAPAGTEPDGSEADGSGAGNAAENAVEEAAAGATAVKEPAEDDGGSAEAHTDPEPVAVTGTDSTEIPQQQSAKEAADNEAGEGART